MRNLSMKMQYKNDLRRWTTDTETLTIASLERKIRDLYFPSAQGKTCPEFVTKYVDEDGDLVTLETQDDMDECLSREDLNKLRIYVSTLEDGEYLCFLNVSAT